MKFQVLLINVLMMQKTEFQNCLSCLSNSGAKRISPGEIIYEGSFWQVEHVFPTGLLGWLVIVLKRHSEKLHELSQDEWRELADINYKLTRTLHKILDSEKEYSCCFAEMEGFRHIHYHLIPKTKDFDAENTGAKVFRYLRVKEDECISKERIIEFCKRLKNEIN